MKNDFLSWFVISLSSIFLLIVIVCYAFGLRFNSTNSMPIGIYQINKKSLSRGDLVEVCLPDRVAKFAFERGYLSVGKCKNGIEPVIKQVVGMEHDVVNLQKNFISINQKVLPHSETFVKDRKGRDMLSVKRGQIILKANEVWLYGNNNVYSFDSRYFGAIETRLIQSVLKPVFVFSN